ncbi:hypothetical protein [Gemmiger sp.]|uniref:hypothetical protein n=1 Tax=Gemmiger sp. TaxID=2049027 RepID=UPI002A914953|nr:hypothetical protein [Gemmiger sp.]
MAVTSPLIPPVPQGTMVQSIFYYSLFYCFWQFCLTFEAKSVRTGMFWLIFDETTKKSSHENFDFPRQRGMTKPYHAKEGNGCKPLPSSPVILKKVR